MAFNVANCTDEEKTRLFCRRFGYCSDKLLHKMNKDKTFGDLPKFIPLMRIIGLWIQPNLKRRHIRGPTLAYQWAGHVGFELISMDIVVEVVSGIIRRGGGRLPLCVLFHGRHTP